MTTRKLTLVSSMPEFYGHQGHAAADRGEGFGCSCAKCGREVAAPFGCEKMVVWCLYCGLDEGHFAAIESPFEHHKWSFGVTREEAAEERGWVEKGCFDEMAERRARRHGHVIDFFSYGR